MPKIDAYEHEILTAIEKGQWTSVARKAELAKFKAAARGGKCSGIQAVKSSLRVVVERRTTAPVDFSPSCTYAGATGNGLEAMQRLRTGIPTRPENYRAPGQRSKHHFS